MNDLAASDIIDGDLALPRGVELEDVSFERVLTNQNGSQGIDGALLLGHVDAPTALDLLASEIEGVDYEDVQGEAREEIFDDATSWIPLSRFEALQMLFANRAANEGEELKRGRESVPLPTLLRELGALVSAARTETEFVYSLYRFERGWLLFYVTY